MNVMTSSGMLAGEGGGQPGMSTRSVAVLFSNLRNKFTFVFAK